VLNAILLVYNRPPYLDASTIMEHINSFENYSDFEVIKINTATGIPAGLYRYQFKAIVLHYSLFGDWPFKLNEQMVQYIKSSMVSCKIAFFQDEYRYCPQRFRLIDELQLDIIFTLFDEKQANLVYRNNTKTKNIYSTLTGYVCDTLIEKTSEFIKPHGERQIDVGYRARPLPVELGQGAQEKTQIAFRFLDFSSSTSLKLDVKTGEEDRIYGDDWYRFMGNCRFVLGVEAGVSIVDLDGKVRCLVSQAKENGMSDPELTRLLEPFENNISYRTISPRVFEAIAMRTGLILFEGSYNGVIEPGKHYIELKKDFSNLKDVLERISDTKGVEEMVGRAYDDVIASHRYHYRTFIQDFEQVLKNLGVVPSAYSGDIEQARRVLSQDTIYFRVRAYILGLRHKKFYGRNLVKKLYHVLRR